MSIARISLLVVAAALAATSLARAQVPADLRAAMQARDTAFYAVDAAQWEKYTAPTFSRINAEANWLSRDSSVAACGFWKCGRQKQARGRS
jgi:hypothetical protein